MVQQIEHGATPHHLTCLCASRRFHQLPSQSQPGLACSNVLSRCDGKPAQLILQWAHPQMDAGADVTATAPSGNTTLHCAHARLPTSCSTLTRYSHQVLSRCCTAHIVMPEVRTIQKVRLVWLSSAVDAAFSGHVGLVRRILAEHPGLAMAVSRNGNIPQYTYCVNKLKFLKDKRVRSPCSARVHVPRSVGHHTISCESNPLCLSLAGFW